MYSAYRRLLDEEGRRLVKVGCFDACGIKNFWRRPIEGLIAVVDHQKAEVVKLIDTGVVPIQNLQYSPGRAGETAGAVQFQFDRAVAWTHLQG